MTDEPDDGWSKKSIYDQAENVLLCPDCGNAMVSQGMKPMDPPIYQHACPECLIYAETHKGKTTLDREWLKEVWGRGGSMKAVLELLRMSRSLK